jgi:hypothetical protein
VRNRCQFIVERNADLAIPPLRSKLPTPIVSTVTRAAYLSIELQHMLSIEAMSSSMSNLVQDTPSKEKKMLQVAVLSNHSLGQHVVLRYLVMPLSMEAKVVMWQGPTKTHRRGGSRRGGRVATGRSCSGEL